MKPGLFFTILAFSFMACNEFDNKSGNEDTSEHGRKLPGNMKYSFDCLKTDSSESDFAEKADEFIGKLVTLNIDVSDEEQMKYGDTFLLESVKNKQFKIAERHPQQFKLDTILRHLVAQRTKPTDIEYKLFVLDDDKTINAFTVGGKILITTAMLNKVKNDDQLYAIIGHEIGHNEKGHIKASLKQVKAGKRLFGDWGEVAVALKRLLTGSFNQKYELEADYYGLDLTWKAGYDVCAIQSFWEELAKGEQKEDWYDFFRTHPYSDVRSKCLHNHMQQNFKLDCK